MATVALITKLLALTSDLCTVVSFFPVMIHLRFGHLLKTAGSESKKGEAPAARVPPAAAMAMLAAAEVCATLQLLDPSDAVARRAMGTIVRTVRPIRSGQSAGFKEHLGIYAKLMGDEDVLTLVKFVVITSGFLTLFVGIAFHPEKHKAEVNPFKLASRFATSLVMSLASLRGWCMLAVAGGFWFGPGGAMLAKALRKPPVQGLLRAAAGPLRAGAAGLMAVETEESPTQLFACGQAAAAAARAARVVVRERLTMAAVLAGGLFAGSGDMAAHGATLTMEALVFVFLLPCLLGKQNWVLRLLRLLLLCAPAVLFALGNAELERMLPAAEVFGQLAAVFGMCGLMVPFLGGFQSMMAALGLVQGLLTLHRAHKMNF